MQERDAARAHGQPRPVRRLQRQPAAGRLPSLARAEADGAQLPAGNRRQDAASPRSSFAASRPTSTYTHFEDKPSFDEVDVIANRYLDEYVTGKLDRLDVVYTKFVSIARQHVAVETLLPLRRLAAPADAHWQSQQPSRRRSRRPPQRSTSSCRRPKAFWKKSCRPASRSSCSSASWIRP